MNSRELLNCGGLNIDILSFTLAQISYKFEDSDQSHLDAGWEYRLLSRHVQTIHVHKKEMEFWKDTRPMITTIISDTHSKSTIHPFRSIKIYHCPLILV
jgi:hypothetical protein